MPHTHPPGQLLGVSFGEPSVFDSWAPRVLYISPLVTPGLSPQKEVPFA